MHRANDATQLPYQQAAWRKRRLTAVIAFLLVIHSALLVHSAKVHSPTWDEVGYMAAGLSHWELGRFELYSVNPPLVRTIATAPVYWFMQPKVDWSLYRSAPHLRSEVYVGRQFIEQHGEKSFDYFFVARLAVIPISLLGAWLCFLWAKELFGVGAGILAMVMWCFSPNVLAYGSVITADLGAAVAMMAASYMFYRWLREPTWSWALLLSCVTALAMLTKSTWLMLPLIYLVIGGLRWVVLRLKPSGDTTNGLQVVIGRKQWWGQFAVASCLALLFTNGFYGFSGSLTSLGDLEFVSSTFSGNQPRSISASGEQLVVAGEPCEDCDSKAAVASVLPPKPGNRFAGTLLAGLPLPIPANYLQGIDVQTRDFERGRYDAGWKSYLFGQWQQGGWWYYYLVALFFKIPIATWLIIGAGSLMALVWRADGRRWQAVLCLWVPAIAVLLLISSSTGLNRYMRYALPVLPVLYIWGSQLGQLFESWPEGFKGRRLAAVPAVLAVCLVGTSLSNAPNHLSYFNSMAGGPSEGYKILCDSNVDWGQDLIELKSWLAKNPEAAKDLHLAYFGCFDPKWVGIDYRLSEPLIHGEHSAQWSHLLGPVPGFHVVSKNFVAGHPMPVPDCTGAYRFRYFDEGAFDYFSRLSPSAQIGDSMLVYQLSLDQVNELRSHYKLNKLRVRVTKSDEVADREASSTKNNVQSESTSDSTQSSNPALAVSQ